LVSDWSSDVCSSDLTQEGDGVLQAVDAARHDRVGNETVERAASTA